MKKFFENFLFIAGEIILVLGYIFAFIFRIVFLAIGVVATVAGVLCFIKMPTNLSVIDEIFGMLISLSGITFGPFVIAKAICNTDDTMTELHQFDCWFCI